MCLQNLLYCGVCVINFLFLKTIILCYEFELLFFFGNEYLLGKKFHGKKKPKTDTWLINAILNFIKTQKKKKRPNLKEMTCRT